MTENNKLREKDTEISLETAEKWAKNWKDPKSDSDSKNKVNAYLIPKINLELVLKQGIDAVRAYIGINDAGEQTLMIVGTRYNEKTGIYEDMLPKGVDAEGRYGDETSPAIYDFSQPCPPQGDPSSPLNNM
ncbi:hypothetical protein OIU80_19615 [Flavobacterium sp. LS1R47]|uniref:Uncharacterized protein n=1 Tax=Flavobacterium frigoritolerans TaxID=2987686 RepID=A0A9X3HNH8_9FLAO|nr:hypothetical protein [Flavobacterium frigoritolerans]MCV9934494.1 hypothetical protein [Flavobacterium frigoritolerans]